MAVVVKPVEHLHAGTDVEANTEVKCYINQETSMYTSELTRIPNNLLLVVGIFLTNLLQNLDF